MRSVLLVALALSALALACSDKRCSATNCDAMINACRVELGGDPNILVCIKTGLMASATYKDQIAGDCAEACAAGNSGAIVECLATKKQDCLDAGTNGAKLDAVLTSCLPTGGAPNEPCQTACDTTRKTCETACPVTTWDACLSCVKTCGLNSAHCYTGC